MIEALNVTGGYSQDPLGLWFITHPLEVMTVIFLAFVILFVLNAKTIKNSFSGVKRKTWLVLLLIFIIGFWLRNAEYRYGAGYDGYFYLNSAKLMFEHNIQAWSCGIGNDDHCYLYNQHLAPAGYPYLIYLSYVLFGVHDIYAMMISGLLGSLTILLVFLITYLLFKEERPAMYSAMIFAFIPFDIFLSSTAAVRPTSLFFTGLTFLLYLLALKKDDIKLWCLVAITFSYSIYTRQENSVLLFPMILLFIFEKKPDLKRLYKLDIFGFLKKYSLPLLTFLVSQIPVQHWVLLFMSMNRLYNIQNFPVLAGAILGTFFSPQNFIGNVFFYNPIISVFFIISPLLLIIRNYRSKVIIVWSWFLAYFILYSIYFQCVGFPEYFCLEYLRYMQHLHIPIAILAGLVFYEAEKRIHLKHVNWAFFFLLFVITFSFLFYSANISGVEFTLFKDGRMEEPFTSEMIKAVNKTPPDSVIFISQAIIPRFDYFENDDRIVVDTNIYNLNNYTWTKNLLDNVNGRPIYFIDDGACGDYLENTQCDFIRENFELNKIESVNRIRIFELK